ncbi:MAG: hypothetical protein BM556_01645 [Bacteriovorax sp. MedPE-SWde]|mgnify:FL=1|nr:MAG: hypothetical protein BM556_01645 [Bacteriovorax sp. MedPE-SWde]
MKLILVFLFILNLSAWSADLHLFKDDGSFNDYFSTSILSGDLKEGENIHLYDRKVTFKGILGSGNTTMILRVQDTSRNIELALRLPHGNEEKRFGINDGKRFINYTYDGYKDLKEAKLPIPKIHSYLKSSYLLVDLVEHDFDLKTFLARNEFIEESDRSKIQESLLKFAKETAIYESIGDFHLEQIVYSKQKNKWILLDWADNHQLARLPSSPKLFNSHQLVSNNIALDKNGKELYEELDNGKTVKVHRDITEFEKNILNLLHEEIENQRRVQESIDKSTIEELKIKLQGLSDHTDIMDVYKDLKSAHLASFFTVLQKDFVDNQLKKFPIGIIKKPELKILLDNLGKFTPYYFSQFSEKILTNINDLESFMFLYQRIKDIGLDEDLEDDIADAITKNIERILSNTTSDEKALKTIETLKNEYGIISYRTRNILDKADEYLKPAPNCNDTLFSILNATN